MTLPPSEQIDARLIQAIRKTCSKTNVPPDMVCAFADFLSNGTPFVRSQSGLFESQTAAAAKIMKIGREELAEYFIEEFGAKSLPTFAFNEKTWASISSLNLKGVDTLTKCLLSSELGLFRASGRDYIFTRPIVGRPIAWRPTLKELATKLHLQISDFVSRIEKLTATLDKREDVFTAFCRVRGGLGAVEVLSPMADAAALAALQKKYKMAIRAQDTAGALKAKEAGNGVGHIFGNDTAQAT